MHINIIKNAAFMLENYKIQIYKIGNNITTFGTGKEIIFFTVQIKSNILI
jgi:hypothetical protein